MQREVDLKIIFQVLRARWIWIAVSTIALGLVFLLGSKFLLTPQYTSSIEMYVYNSNAGSQANLNINDINASQKLVTTYMVILQNPSVMDEVTKQVNEKMNLNLSASELNQYIDMTSVKGTEVLRISARTEDKVLSAAICNVIAGIAPNVLQQVIEAGSVKVIGEEAKPASSPSWPNQTQNAGLGAIIGLLLSSGILISAFLFDTTIKGEEDFREHFDIVFLGEIPHLSEKENLPMKDHEVL